MVINHPLIRFSWGCVHHVEDHAVTQKNTAILIFLLFLGTAIAYWSRGFAAAAVLLILGLGYGFVFYKARLCFASAFYGKRELMRGILLGLMLASIGSAVVVALGLNRVVMVPYGLHTLLGSALFGFALPFAGGCMTGTLYRLGGGQSKSLATFLGLLLGNALGAAYVWRLTEPMLNWSWRIYLPDVIGLAPAVILNLALLAFLYWRLGGEPKRFVRLPVRAWLAAEWPAWMGGVALALLFIIQFAYHSALTVQVPLARFSLWVGGLLGFPIKDLAWANFWGLRIPALDAGFLLDVGLIFGAMIGALMMNEFGYFRAWNVRHALVGFLGGLVMGLAVWLAIGCNVSGFWSTVATLRFEGWLYAAGMLLGTRLGLRTVNALVERDIL
jgi:uncharacterized membrane protein YedE/YeeE